MAGRGPNSKKQAFQWTKSGRCWYLSRGEEWTVPGRFTGIDASYMPENYSSDLFVCFSRLESGREAILCFAAEYGFLRADLVRTFPVPRGGGKKGRSLCIGEPYDLWRSAIEELADCITLWAAIQKRDNRVLEKRILFLGQDTVGYASADKSADPKPQSFLKCETIASRNHHPWLFERFGNKNRIAYATCYLEQTVSAKLKGLVYPRLALSSMSTDLHVLHVATSLLGLIWFQFAQALARRASFHACQQCSALFEVSLNAKRADTKFCRGPCKQKHYRDKKLAKKLREQGWKIKDIAKRLHRELGETRKLLK